MTASSSQPDAEAIPPTRRWYRSIAPSFLVTSFLLLAWPYGGVDGFVLRLLAAIAFLVLSIVCGVLARQWTFVKVVVGTIVAGFVGLNLVLPNLLRTGDPPYETPAVANLRTINTAEVTYLSYSGSGYGTMTDLIHARLLDDTFVLTKEGYDYSITLDAIGSVYTAEAVPAPVVPKSSWWSSSTPSNNTRRYAYYSAPDAVVRYSTNASFAPAGQSGRSVQ